MFIKLIDFNFLPSIMKDLPLLVTQVARLLIPKLIASTWFLSKFLCSSFTS